MIAIILAGGFAKRLYPLTENKSKCLLEIKGKPIIDYTLKKIHEVKEIKKIIVATNHKFYDDFLEWGREKDVEIWDNKVSSEEEKQKISGTIPDVLKIIDEKKLNEDMLIIAGDTLFKSPLSELYKKFKEENKNLNLAFNLNSLEKARRFGILSVKNNILIDFQEKPEHPSSTLCSVPIYFYKKETIPLMRQFVKESPNRDPPGKFLEYIHKKAPVYIANEEDYIDIGTIEEFRQAQNFF